MLRASLGTCFIAAALLSANPAHAGDLSIANVGAGCVQPVAWQPNAERCALVEPSARQQILSDHGMTAGEAYDAQGNPLDRHGDVIAVPASRGSQAREVFASERGTFR